MTVNCCETDRRHGGQYRVMRDLDQDTAEERTYECFECGTVVSAASPPGECPECGGQMRNREMPLE